MPPSPLIKTMITQNTKLKDETGSSPAANDPTLSVHVCLLVQLLSSACCNQPGSEERFHRLSRLHGEKQVASRQMTNG